MSLFLAVSLALFEQRIGALEKNPPPLSVKLFESIKKIQYTTLELMMIPVPIARMFNLKAWKQHVENWQILFDASLYLIIKFEWVLIKRGNTWLSETIII